jgi:hypothetical protein
MRGFLLAILTGSIYQVVLTIPFCFAIAYPVHTFWDRFFYAFAVLILFIGTWANVRITAKEMYARWPSRS